MNIPRILSSRFLLSSVYAATALFAADASADSTALDASFGTSGRTTYTFGDSFTTLAHLPRSDGGSVAVLNFRYADAPTLCVNGRECIALYPYTSAGVLIAPAAPVPAINFSTVRAAAIDSSDRVIIVGSTQISGSNHDFRVVRMLPNGQPDTAFGGDGIVDIAFDLGGNNSDYANAVAIDPLGRIVVAGQVQRATADDTDFGIARLNANGTLDTTFNSTGKRAVLFDLGPSLRIDAAYAIAIGSDNRITVGGIALDSAVSVSRTALARLTGSGAFDTTFCPGSCNFMSTYTSINSGRRVLYFGSDTPAHADSLDAMSLNSAGDLVIAGTTPGGTGETLGYAQRISDSGNYVNEISTQGGVTGGSRVYIGGVHWTVGSNIVLTGTSGPNEEFFFAQRFSSAFAPSTGWGFIGPDNSVYLWSASGGFGDVGDDRPARSSIDSSYRILTGGSYKVSSTASPYSAVIARLSYNGPLPADAVFKNSFE